MPWVKNPELPVESWSQLLSPPGGPSAQVSRCHAAAAGFPPPSFPPGSTCFHAEGSLCEAPKALGKTTWKWETPLWNSGPQGSFLSQGPYLCPAAVAAGRCQERETEAWAGGHSPHCPQWWPGLGRRREAELCLHDSLTEPAFCKILCRAAAPWTLLPSTLVLGLRNHPLPGARPGPRPLGLTSAAGGSVWPISGGLAQARTEAVASSGDPLWLLQGTCSPHGGAGPELLPTAPLISSLVSPALSALNGVISPSAGTTFSEQMPVRS